MTKSTISLNCSQSVLPFLVFVVNDLSRGNFAGSKVVPGRLNNICVVTYVCSADSVRESLYYPPFKEDNRPVDFSVDVRGLRTTVPGSGRRVRRLLRVTTYHSFDGDTYTTTVSRVRPSSLLCNLCLHEIPRFYLVSFIFRIQSLP